MVMSMQPTLRDRVRAFGREERGATAVEFAIVLPVMLVIFAVIVEGSRIYWNYQAAVGGVRDAARYLARMVNVDVCTAGGTTFPTTSSSEAQGIVERNMKSGVGAQRLFPSGVSLADTDPVTAQLQCVAIAGLGTVPVVRVNANVEIELPFNLLTSFFVASPNGLLSTTITDQSRIYGL